VNHALRPNVVRACVGHTVLYRLLRDVQTGEELLDNYLDLRLPRAKRAENLEEGHGIVDEGPDEFDAPDDMVLGLGRRLDAAEKHVKAGRLEAAFKGLATATNLCSESGKRDPAFTDAFRGFAEVAGCLDGGEEMHLEGLAMALEHATVREPYSVMSCALSAQLLGAAMDRLPASEWRSVAAVAREHVARVYGPEPGIFEAINPALAGKEEASGCGEKEAADQGEAEANAAAMAPSREEASQGVRKRQAQKDENAEEGGEKRAKVGEHASV